MVAGTTRGANRTGPRQCILGFESRKNHIPLRLSEALNGSALEGEERNNEEWNCYRQFKAVSVFNVPGRRVSEKAYQGFYTRSSSKGKSGYRPGA